MNSSYDDQEYRVQAKMFQLQEQLEEIQIKRRGPDFYKNKKKDRKRKQLAPHWKGLPNGSTFTINKGIFQKLTLEEGVLLSYLCHDSIRRRAVQYEGWFKCPVARLEEELGIPAAEQKRLLDILKKKKLIKVGRSPSCPPIRKIKIDLDRVNSL